MASGISRPDGNDPAQGKNNEPQPIQTGMTKMYTAAKAPGVARMLEHWFPGEVTPQMIQSFLQGMMKMINNSLNEAKVQHEKVQEEIKKRIEEE